MHVISNPPPGGGDRIWWRVPAGNPALDNSIGTGHKAITI
jgi:hypothetical protein